MSNTNECNGKNVTINVCGCCSCSTESETRVIDTVLYDNAINRAGTYTLADDINNYTDVFIIHEYRDNSSRQSACFPVSCLGQSNVVCHGDGTLGAYVHFTITNNILNAIHVEDNYNIVKIVGRKL